jgi:hypothetical protein
MNPQILLQDYIHLQTNVFQHHKMKSIVCICHPQNLFILALLIEKKIHVQNIVLEKDQNIAENLQREHPNEYRILHCIDPISLMDFVFIDTGDSTQDRALVGIFLEKNPACFLLARLSTTEERAGYSRLPISHDLAVFVKNPANFPGRFALLHIDAYPYSFNSSCISISLETFEPSTCHTSDGVLVYSFRTAMTKFCESALGFLSEDHIIPEFYQPNETNRIVREDFRFFVWKGELYGSYTYITPYVAGVKTFQNLTVGKFTYSPNGIKLLSECSPPYAGNLVNQPEKSWTWWESPNGQLHCVYYFSPLKILSFSSLDSAPSEITHEDDKDILKGHVRGGACGVVWDSKVWCFTHTVTDSGGFNIGVVVLSHEEIPRILGWNHELVKSADFAHVLFYVCGAVYCPKTATWHLTGGVQDSKCFTLDLSHNYLCANIQWIPKNKIE